MSDQLQHKISIASNNTKIQIAFILVCSLAFIISIVTTIYFYSSMCCDMDMPGGWTMSMMWMRMPGQTWVSSFISFILMWLAMMIAMMIPSALPMFLKTKKRLAFLGYSALGYFFVWLIAGVMVYLLAMMFANAAMQSVSLSRVVPLLFGVMLIVAGTYQFTKLKMTNLLHCRSQFGCSILNLTNEKSFQLGCKQGLVCCTCCSGLMTIQIIFGIMNPFAMVAVALAITIEKLFPKPIIAARLVGIAAIIFGIISILKWLYNS